MPAPKDIAAKVIANTIRDDDGCWVWVGKFNHSAGQPLTWHCGAWLDVRRWLWRAWTGRGIADGKVLVHCDRHPRCVHPEHQGPVLTRAQMNRQRAPRAA